MVGQLRLRVFRALCEEDRARLGGAWDAGAPWARHHAITVRRDALLADGMAGLGALTAAQLKGPVRIRFVNGLGAEEAGVDGGGLFKDFMDDLVKQAFSPGTGLFRASDEQARPPCSLPNTCSTPLLNRASELPTARATRTVASEQLSSIVCADPPVLSHCSAQELYPDPAATSAADQPRFRFLGAVLGKTLYEGLLAEVLSPSHSVHLHSSSLGLIPP